MLTQSISAIKQCNQAGDVATKCCPRKTTGQKSENITLFQHRLCVVTLWFERQTTASSTKITFTLLAAYIVLVTTDFELHSVIVNQQTQLHHVPAQFSNRYLHTRHSVCQIATSRLFFHHPNYIEPIADCLARYSTNAKELLKAKLFRITRSYKLLKRWMYMTKSLRLWLASKH